MREIVEAANRGNVTIYPLDPWASRWRGGVGDKGTLYQLAAETGGRTDHQHERLRGGLEHGVRGRHQRVLRPRLHADADRGRREVPQDQREGETLGHARARAAGLLRAEQQGTGGRGRGVGAGARAAGGRRPRTLARQAAGEAAGRRVGGSVEGQGARTKVVVAWDPVDPRRRRLRSASVDVEASRRRGRAPPPQSTAGPGGREAARGRRRFELAAGSVLAAVHGARPRTGRSWTSGPSLTAPDWAAAPSPCRRRASTAPSRCPEWRAIQASPDPVPSAVRQFVRTDRVLVAVECYSSRPDFTARVERPRADPGGPGTDRVARARPGTGSRQVRASCR